jgi:hypothetical protein
MPEKRTLEDRYYAYLLNTTESITAHQAGEVVTYSTKAGAESFIEPELIITPSILIEARKKAVERVRRTFDFDWSQFNA